MSYKSDIELMCQLDILENMTKVLVSKAERLAKLWAEGKVSDSVYRECSNEMKKRADDIAHDNDELFLLADSSIKQMNSESIRLRHQLELLEVRHAIGMIPKDGYKVIQEGINMQLDDMDRIQYRIKEVMAVITETSRHMGQFASSKVEEAVPPKHMELETSQPTAPSESIPETTSSKAKIKSTEPNMIICPKCLAENRESASFCFNCGTKLISTTRVSINKEKRIS